MSALDVLESIINSDGFESRVRALRDEAAVAGDLEQVAVCDEALLDVSTGNPACLDCANVLRAAEEN